MSRSKFAILCSALRANFGFDKDTSKLMILVSFMDQKFARWTRGNDGANFMIHDIAERFRRRLRRDMRLQGTARTG